MKKIRINAEADLTDLSDPNALTPGDILEDRELKLEITGIVNIEELEQINDFFKTLIEKNESNIQKNRPEDKGPDAEEYSEEVCVHCNGTGEVRVTESVYPGEPHMADTDVEKCICQIGYDEDEKIDD